MGREEREVREKKGGKWEGRKEGRRKEGKGREGGREGRNSLKLASKSDQGTGFIAPTAEIQGDLRNVTLLWC